MAVRNIFLAGLLAFSPLTAAVAQQSTSPGLKAGSTTELTAVKNGSAANPHQPGATGSTVVPGDKITVSGDSKATSLEQKNNTSGGGK